MGGHRDDNDVALGAAFERLPHAVVMLRDGTITVANRRARMLLGAGQDFPVWPIGEPIDEVARFVDETGRRVEFPSRPPQVGDRYAERIVYVENIARPRDAGLDGRDSDVGGDLGTVGDPDVGGDRGTVGDPGVGSDPGSDPGVGTDRTLREPRPLAMEGCWSSGELVLTFRNAARRDAAVRRQGDVVATVAHEIRSPLTSVKGFTRTLLSRWDRFSDEEKRTMLATIEQDADRVTRLLTDLLEVSRIDAGRVRLNRSRVDVTALIRSVVDKARMRSEQPEVEVVIDGVVPYLDADRDKIEQVLTNLLDNALVHAKGTPVTVTAATEEEILRITVADRGPGVDPAAAPQLFRKFGRGRSDNRAGTGLGLFLAKGLAEAHGGRIWFDPDVATGATIHVELPIDAH